jgi:uncharacterized membrane protein
MKQEEFLKELERELRSLPDASRQEILADYAEHFRTGRERGRSDDEIARALGSAHDIARSFVAERRIEQAEHSTSVGGQLRYGIQAIATVVGIGVFNIIFVAIPYLVMLSILAGLWTGAASIAIAGGALGALAFAPITIGRDWVIENISIISTWQSCETQFRVLAGLSGLGTLFLGTLGIIGMVVATRLSVKGTLWYARLNLKLATRSGEKP